MTSGVLFICVLACMNKGCSHHNHYRRRREKFACCGLGCPTNFIPPVVKLAGGGRFAEHRWFNALIVIAMYATMYAQQEIALAIREDLNAQNTPLQGWNPVKVLQWLGYLPTGPATGNGTIPEANNGTPTGQQLTADDVYTVVSTVMSLGFLTAAAAWATGDPRRAHAMQPKTTALAVFATLIGLADSLAQAIVCWAIVDLYERRAGHGNVQQALSTGHGPPGALRWCFLCLEHARTGAVHLIRPMLTRSLC